MPKYNYFQVLQTYTGSQYGWEDTCAETSKAEMRDRLKEYQENEGGTYRVIGRRELAA